MQRCLVMGLGLVITGLLPPPRGTHTGRPRFGCTAIIKVSILILCCYYSCSSVALDHSLFIVVFFSIYIVNALFPVFTNSHCLVTMKIACQFTFFPSLGSPAVTRCKTYVYSPPLLCTKLTACSASASLIQNRHL